VVSIYIYIPLVLTLKSLYVASELCVCVPSYVCGCVPYVCFPCDVCVFRVMCVLFRVNCEYVFREMCMCSV